MFSFLIVILNPIAEYKFALFLMFCLLQLTTRHNLPFSILQACRRAPREDRRAKARKEKEAHPRAVMVVKGRRAKAHPRAAKVQRAMAQKEKEVHPRAVMAAKGQKEKAPKEKEAHLKAQKAAKEQADSTEMTTDLITPPQDHTK